jgi:hypothetical protein
MVQNFNDYQQNYTNEKKTNHGFSGLSITILSIAITGCLFTSWYLFNNSKDKTDGNIIVINADNEEIKTKPSDPGGMVVDNMDRVIYDTIDGYKQNEEPEVKILPTPEEPIDKTKLVEASKESPTENDKIEERIIIDTKVDIVENKTIDKEEEEYIKPVVKAQTSKKLQELANQQENGFKIQLASFRSKTDAQKEWDNLSRKFPKLISKYKHSIVSKNIEGKGIFYRLHVGSFNSESEAQKTCKNLKKMA